MNSNTKNINTTNTDSSNNKNKVSKKRALISVGAIALILVIITTFIISSFAMATADVYDNSAIVTERDWATISESPTVKMFSPNGRLTKDTYTNAYGCTFEEACSTLSYLLGDNCSFDTDRYVKLVTAVAVDDNCYDDPANAALVYSAYAVLNYDLPRNLNYLCAQYDGPKVRLFFTNEDGLEIEYVVDYSKSKVKCKTSGEYLNTGMFDKDEVGLWASTMCTGAQLKTYKDAGQEHLLDYKNLIK